jgi:lipopolysaccharide/colanic/teichoic acid biosynthesis glycosyltransferase
LREKMPYNYSKRLFDMVASFAGLLLLSPILIFIAIVIKMNSPGPVFFRGVRVGLDGRPFKIFKFRTMVLNADKIGGPSTSDDDPRITSIGNKLRKFKLDELPQLINVFIGQMSIVGPRPEVQHYVNMFTEEEKAILSVRPGITDWASIWNPDEGAILAGSPDPEKTYMEKIRPNKLKLQLKYVKERSLSVDIKIIIETVRAIIRREKPALTSEVE